MEVRSVLSGLSECDMYPDLRGCVGWLWHLAALSDLASHAHAFTYTLCIMFRSSLTMSVMSSFTKLYVHLLQQTPPMLQQQWHRPPSCKHKLPRLWPRWVSSPNLPTFILYHCVAYMWDSIKPWLMECLKRDVQIQFMSSNENDGKEGTHERQTVVGEKRKKKLL